MEKKKRIKSAVICFIGLFVLFFISSIILNKRHYSLTQFAFENQIQIIIMSIYSQSRDAYVLYNNTPRINMRGIDKETQSNVTFISNQNSKKNSSPLFAPDFFNPLNHIMGNLQGLTKNNIISLALIDFNQQYAYIIPYHDYYQKILTNNNQDSDYASSLQKMLKEYDISEDYLLGNAEHCPVFITKEYTEQYTKKNMISVIQPVYNKEKLQGVISIDIKNSFISDTLHNFNEKYNTHLFLSRDKGYKLHLPCLMENVYLNYNYFSLISIIGFIASTALALFFSLLFYRYTYVRDNAYKDKLTGVYNRAYVLHNLKRMPRSYGLFIFDIDNFKNINDSYGHDVGDLVLQDVCFIISSAVRGEDIIARWGGEEFVLIISSTDLDMQINRVESIRKLISNASIIEIPVTVSIGGTQVVNSNFEHAFKHADTLLYKAKNSGKNMLQYSVLAD